VALTPTNLVERFYYCVWNKADEVEARQILDADFRFRASLGPELRGPEGFITYIHLGRFFGAEPSGREIRWSGAAFFKVRDGKITELWVLGDIEAIRRQLDPQRALADFQV
jgi:hypothetical protein